LQVHYVVGKEGKDASLIVGHITRELLDKAMPKSDEDCKVFVCGPPGLCNFVSGNKVSQMDQVCETLNFISGNKISQMDHFICL
jgi:NAD(P)H-flavin reductase